MDRPELARQHGHLPRVAPLLGTERTQQCFLFSAVALVLPYDERCDSNVTRVCPARVILVCTLLIRFEGLCTRGQVILYLVQQAVTRLIGGNQRPVQWAKGKGEERGSWPGGSAGQVQLRETWGEGMKALPASDPQNDPQGVA